MMLRVSANGRYWNWIRAGVFARALGIQPATVARWIAAGHLVRHRSSTIHNVRITTRSAKEWIERWVLTKRGARHMANHYAGIRSLVETPTPPPKCRVIRPVSVISSEQARKEADTRDILARPGRYWT